MSGNNVYNTALGLLGEPSSSQGDYDDEVVVELINVLLSEVFPYNNSLRKSREKEELSEIPQIAALGDPIGYEAVMLLECLPYGLAAHLALSDDETGKAQFYNAKYEAVREGQSASVIGAVVDVYS